MFGWLTGKKQISASMDYFYELQKQIEILEEKVKKLECRAQLKQSGEIKVYGPSTTKKKIRRPNLTLEEVNSIESDFLNGWKCKQVCSKYGIGEATFYRITGKKHERQTEVKK